MPRWWKKKNIESLSYLERNPEARAYYLRLSPGQRRILDQVNLREQERTEKDKAYVMQRLIDRGHIPLPASNLPKKLLSKHLKTEADILMQICLFKILLE